MKIIDHGKWIPYKPTKWPEAAPPNALFAKRESDGVDWYEYVNPPATNFQADSVKIAFTFHEFEKQWIIGPSVIDATMIFPPNHYVREIIGFGSTDEDEIIKAFRNKVINRDTSEILGDRAAFAPPSPSVNLHEAVMALKDRVEKLERYVEAMRTP